MPSVTDNSERPAGVRDAVESLGRASKLRANQRAVKVTGVVDAICRYAFDDGLDADSLRAVVRIVTKKTELDQSSVTSLIKNLYSAQKIPSDVVVTVVGALGQGKGKPSLGTQNGLVKWLTTVHEIIDDPKTLTRLYGVLFGMLDMISIRTSLCHLLSLITRRRNVKPFRIQQLLEFSRGLGNEPALQGLLRIYKDYYPDIILASTTAGRNSFPPRPDDEWRKRLVAIQEAGVAANEGTLEQHNGFRVLRKGPKRSKVSAIPEVHTFRANETSVTLEEIDSVEDYVEKLERIEPPSQMVSFLADPLLQKYVDLRPSPIISTRIEFWLSTCLEEEYNAIKSGFNASANLLEILEGLHRHAGYAKTLLPIVPTFLKAYLPVWDGVTAVDALLGLLSYTTLQPFRGAYANYFGPVERSLGGRGPMSYEKLLHFYTELLQHWATQNSNPPSSPLRPAITYPNRTEFEDLGVHVSSVSASLLLSLPDGSSGSLRSSILSFYELLSSSSKPGVVPIILPPAYLSYRLAQSGSTATLSRLCGIYANYKGSFDRHPMPISSYYPQSMTGPFNSCLRDLYNLLWASKALQVVDKSPAFFCDPSLRDALNGYLANLGPEYAVGLAFDLSHNAYLASLSAAAWSSLEEVESKGQGRNHHSMHWHQGPITQQTLEALEQNQGISVSLLDYKKHVLQWLADRGSAGIRDLMYATHARLKK